MVAVCRKTKVRYSITVRLHQSLRNIIEAIPEADWTPIPYWLEGAADVAETSYTPFDSEPDAAPVRLIVRRVKPTPGSQLALFANYSYHAFITDRDGETLELEADHRRHAEIENAPTSSTAWGSTISPRAASPPRRLAGRPGHRPNLARWTARIGLGEQLPPRPLGDASSPWPDGSPARRAASLPSAPALALGEPVQSRPGTIPRAASPVLTRPSATDSTSPPTRARSGPRVLLAVSYPAISLTTAIAGRYQHPQ